MIKRLARQLRKEERDLFVLKAVLSYHPIDASRIAEKTGLDEHKTRYSPRMLEDDGLIISTPDGAVPVDGVDGRIENINAGLDGLTEQVEYLKRFGPE